MMTFQCDTTLWSLLAEVSPHYHWGQKSFSASVSFCSEVCSQFDHAKQKNRSGGAEGENLDKTVVNNNSASYNLTDS